MRYIQYIEISHSGSPFTIRMSVQYAVELQRRKTPKATASKALFDFMREKRAIFIEDTNASSTIR